MKVTAWKTIEVEVECEVETDAIIAEFSQRVGEADKDYWRRALPAIDCITRILGEVKAEVIAAVPENGRAVVVARLIAEVDRWKVKETTP